MIWANRPRTRFGSLAATTKGSGPAVLLLHGVGLRAEAWNPVADLLSTEFSTLAVDLPGHGESGVPAGLTELSHYTDAIASELANPVIAIGHSMGAMIALDLATRCPASVTGVAALNAIYRRDAEAKRLVSARAASLDGRTVADPETTLQRWFGDDPSPEREACRDWLTSVDPSAYKTAYTVFANSDGPPDEALAGLSCPALFMTGANEPNSTPAMSHAMAAQANARAHIIADAAHMMPMTHASEVGEALLAFCREAAQ